MEKVPEEFEFRVIHGPTGSGKSRLLAALRRAGGQVLDLESLAAHRGSVLGDLPDRPQPSQKSFESALLREFEGFDTAAPVFVEGESKKIGRLQVPESLIARMRGSACVLLDTALEVRVTLLLEEYGHFVANPALLDSQLDCLAGLHGRERIAAWKALAARSAWREFVAALLREHYDPAYRRSSQRNFAQLPRADAISIRAAHDAAFDLAARQVLQATRDCLPVAQ
jgi:tRNA 2-selenouridine synthase